MDCRNDFYHDQFSRELGESLEGAYASEDLRLIKKLQYRLIHTLQQEQREIFIHFVDAYRRRLMRAEGDCYMKGFFMGTEAGKIIAKHELARDE